MKISDLINKYKGAISEVDSQANRIIVSKQEDIFNLYRKQLSNNQRGDGSSIGTYSATYRGNSSIGYGGYSSFPKAEGSPYNMNWSGELFKDFRLEYSNSILIVYNSKADSLPFGDNLAHAQETTKKDIINFVINDLHEWIYNL